MNKYQTLEEESLMKIKLMLAILLVGAMFVSRAAQAEIYFSMSVGSVSYETDAIDPPFDSGLDGSDTSMTMAAGFQASEYFAVEVGYADYGKAEDNIYRDSASGFTYTEEASVSMGAFYIGGVGMLPLND